MDFHDFLETPKFLPLPGGAEPWPRKRKNLRTPLCFCSLAIFWKPQGSHIGVTLLFGKIDFYPCQEGPSPCRASGKPSERPYVFVCFGSLAIFWKPQGSHIGVTSSVAESIPLALTRRRASGAQARGNLRTPLCVCSRAVFLFTEASVVLRLPHAWPAARGCPAPGRG